VLHRQACQAFRQVDRRQTPQPRLDPGFQSRCAHCGKHEGLIRKRHPHPTAVERGRSKRVLAAAEEHGRAIHPVGGHFAVSGPLVPFTGNPRPAFFDEPQRLGA
jgi:ribosomal protein S14